MLIAQGMRDDLALVSNERAFDTYGVKRLWQDRNLRAAGLVDGARTEPGVLQDGEGRVVYPPPFGIAA